MKKNFLIFCVSTAIFGLAAVGVSQNNQGDEKLKSSTAKQTPADLNFANLNLLNGNGFNRNNVNLWYQVSAYDDKAITKKQLLNAKTIVELIPNFPSMWMEDLTLVEVQTKVGGQAFFAKAPSKVLTPEIKQVFEKSPISAVLHFTIHYKAKNAVTGALQPQKMNVQFIVIPEQEATYKEGYNAMINYLKSNSLEKISQEQKDQFKPLTIMFTVNEQGKTENIEMGSCGFKEINNLFLNLIENMPTWKAATNAEGQPVKQQFKFWVGLVGC